MTLTEIQAAITANHDATFAALNEWRRLRAEYERLAKEYEKADSMTPTEVQTDVEMG